MLGVCRRVSASRLERLLRMRAPLPGLLVLANGSAPTQSWFSQARRLWHHFPPISLALLDAALPRSALLSASSILLLSTAALHGFRVHS